MEQADNNLPTHGGIVIAQRLNLRLKPLVGDIFLNHI